MEENLKNGGKKGKCFAFESGSTPVITKNPRVQGTSSEKFQQRVEQKYNIKFDSYWDLHKWTIENYVKFWGELWDYIGIITSKPYDEVFVKTGPGFLDNAWFKGAEFNVAENILRIRDDSVAIIYLDEHGNEDSVTFTELFQEVQLYAAAFRSNGLRKGDTVACFMSNRKEQIFALLATASIGAIWGGPQPCCGEKVASRIISMMDPKFLITVDSHQNEGKTYKLIDYLPFISENAPTLEKIILVVTEEETLSKNLTGIKNLVFLENFLRDGRNADGTVPDLAFEQLPTSHPRSVTFTSGTTGNPKGIIHSPVSILLGMSDFLLHYNVQKGDVIMSNYPTGWILLEWILSTLALGCTVFLYCGSKCYKIRDLNFWDIVAKYKVKFTFMNPTMLTKLEKMEIVPSPDSNLENFKIIYLSGVTMKKENYRFLQEKIKRDLYIDYSYGASESFGVLTGFNFSIPVHVGEAQIPALGMDIQCFDLEGKSVVGKIGEIVVCTPNPSLPKGLLKDADKSILNKTYFNKFDGVWCTDDNGWINSKTNGLNVIGRRADTLLQNGFVYSCYDIYSAIHALEELQDYICVSQEKFKKDQRVILFVKMKEGIPFTPSLKSKIQRQIEMELSAECIPEIILEIADIPYNVNNKKLESVVRYIVENNSIPPVMTIKNPESLKHYLNIHEILNKCHG